MKVLSVYALSPGGVGMGRGLPLALRVANPGGVGMGRGLPLALSTSNPGGVGMGRGLPLAPRVANPGGVGMGRGLPLRRATENAAWRLLNNCLTELSTGSRIETASASNARRIEMFFFMVKSLLTATMKKNWKT